MLKGFSSCPFSTVSGDVSQAATVQRERSCLLTGPSVWRKKTVPAWTSTLDTGWSEERPPKPVMDVTTGQNNTNITYRIVHACKLHLHFTEKH